MVTRNVPQVESESSPSVVPDPLRDDSPVDQNLISDGVERNSPVMDHVEPCTSGVQPESDSEDRFVKVTSEKECNESSELPESFEVVNEIEPDAHVENTTSHFDLSTSRQFIDIPTVENDSGAMGPKRSKRQSRPPNKLQYAQLGNPLISVIQSLLHGLSSALSESVGESDYNKYCNYGSNAASLV